MLIRQISANIATSNRLQFGILNGVKIVNRFGNRNGYYPDDLDNTKWYYLSFKLELIK